MYIILNYYFVVACPPVIEKKVSTPAPNFSSPPMLGSVVIPQSSRIQQNTTNVTLTGTPSDSILSKLDKECNDDETISAALKYLPVAKKLGNSYFSPQL